MYVIVCGVESTSVLYVYMHVRPCPTFDCSTHCDTMQHAATRMYVCMLVHGASGYFRTPKHTTFSSFCLYFFWDCFHLSQMHGASYLDAAHQHTLQHSATHMHICMCVHGASYLDAAHQRTLQHTATHCNTRAYIYTCAWRVITCPCRHTTKHFAAFAPVFFFNFLFSTDGIMLDTSFLVAAQNTNRLVPFVSVLLKSFCNFCLRFVF